jgi:hypothetical protein
MHEYKYTHAKLMQAQLNTNEHIHTYSNTHTVVYKTKKKHIHEYICTHAHIQMQFN